MATYIALDFETTGLKPEEERITQIAAIKMVIEGDKFLPNSQVLEMRRFETLVNPEKEISKFITDLTGIDNEKVKDAPKEHEAIKQFLEFAGENPIVIAQNAPFDLGFLHHATLRAGLEPKVYDFYCTRTMAAILFPNISHRLVDMVKLFDIELKEAHNAIHDVNATIQLFSKLTVIANLMGLNFKNKLVHHEDREMLFIPENKIIISLKSNKK